LFFSLPLYFGEIPPLPLFFIASHRGKLKCHIAATGNLVFPAVAVSTFTYCSINLQGLFPLNVLTNEKRGGLTMELVLFERSHFKLFSLKFANKSDLSSSCERHKIAQRTMFLLFENNNCFHITLQCRRLMKKSGKLAFHVVNSNVVIDSFPTLQIPLGIVALFEKSYDGEPILTIFFSNIGEDVQYR
jgi:hypothetical protein